MLFLISALTLTSYHSYTILCLEVIALNLSNAFPAVQINDQSLSWRLSLCVTKTACFENTISRLWLQLMFAGVGYHTTVPLRWSQTVVWWWIAVGGIPPADLLHRGLIGRYHVLRDNNTQKDERKPHFGKTTLWKIAKQAYLLPSGLTRQTNSLTPQTLLFPSLFLSCVFLLFISWLTFAQPLIQ